MVQKQKQKQSVIINIGEVVKKKRRRKRVQKKRPPYSQYYTPPPPPPPPPQQDFARVIYPVSVLQPDENIKIQLNAVTKQLADLQEKQLNRTANLMAGIRAGERQAQQELGIEVEPTQEQIGIATEAAPAQPETVIIKRKKKKSSSAEPKPLMPIQTPEAPAILQPIQQPEETADLTPVSFAGPLPRFTSSPTPSLQTEPPGQSSVSPSPTPRRGRPPGRKPSKSRSDKGIPRGQLLRTASTEAIAQGYALAAIRTGGAAIEPPPSQVTWLNPPSAEGQPKL